MPYGLPRILAACAAVLMRPSALSAAVVNAFSLCPPTQPKTILLSPPRRFSSLKRSDSSVVTRKEFLTLNARGRRDGDDYYDDDEDDNDDDGDDRELVYAGRRSGGFGDDDAEQFADERQRASSASYRGYKDDVEFFDLDDDDDAYEDDRVGSDAYGETYNGIIPNPLLDAMDPDGVYERLGPELFTDLTFWRDMALFVVFFALFTPTHHYGTFDAVIEGLKGLPEDFVPGA